MKFLFFPIKAIYLLLILNFVSLNVFGDPDSRHYSLNLERAGFYIATVKLLPGQQEGLWSLSVDKAGGFNDNGFHIEAVLKENGQAAGFMAFNLSKEQSVELTVVKSTDLVVEQLTLQIFQQDESGQRTLVYGPTLTTSAQVLTTPMLVAGFYVVEIQSQADSPRGQFGLSLATQSLVGGIHGGGWLDGTGEGFVSFSVDTPQQVDFALRFGENFGSIGADKPYLAINSQMKDGTQEFYWAPMTRISVDSKGTQADRTSYAPSISANGRYVTFLSYADNLVDDDTIDQNDEFFFIHDRQTKETRWFSLGKLDGSFSRTHIPISSDGRYVSIIFENFSTQKTEKFVYDTHTGEKQTLLEKSEAILIDKGQMSRDERYFVSEALVYDAVAQHLIPDLVVYDYQTDKANLAFSKEDNSIKAVASNLSSDGRYIATDTALVPDDEYWGAEDKYKYWEAIFVQDRETEEITRILAARSITRTLPNPEFCQEVPRPGMFDVCGAMGGTTYIHSPPSISGNGRYVTFESYAIGDVAGNTFESDIYIHDRQTGKTILALTDQSNTPIFIDADGRYLGVLENEQTVLAYDRETEQTFKVAVSNQLRSPHYEQLQISHDGRYIIFIQPNKHQNDLHSLFVHDRQTDKTTSIATSEHFSELHQSTEERYLIFVTEEKHQEGESYSLFSYDYQQEKTLLVAQSQEAFSSVQINANGRYLIFMKEPARHWLYYSPIFVYDHQSQETQMIAVGYEPILSASGRYLVFTSEADDLVPSDTNEVADVFVIELMP